MVDHRQATGRRSNQRAMFMALLDKKILRSDIKLHVCQGDVQYADAQELE